MNMSNNNSEDFGLGNIIEEGLQSSEFFDPGTSNKPTLGVSYQQAVGIIPSPLPIAPGEISGTNFSATNQKYVVQLRSNNNTIIQTNETDNHIRKEVTYAPINPMLKPNFRNKLSTDLTMRRILPQTVQNNPNVKYILLPASTNLLQPLQAKYMVPASNINTLSTSASLPGTEKQQQVMFSSQEIKNATVSEIEIPRCIVQQAEYISNTPCVSQHSDKQFVNSKVTTRPVTNYSIIEQRKKYFLSTPLSNEVASLSREAHTGANLFQTQNIQFTNETQIARSPIPGDGMNSSPVNAESESVVGSMPVPLTDSSKKISDAHVITEIIDDNSEAVTLDNYSATLLNQLEIFKGRHEFCDLTIQIGKMRFNCHSVVVAAMSPLIHDLLLSKSSSKISQFLVILSTQLDVPAFSTIFNALYSGKINLREDNVKKILQICKYLKIHSIQTKCEEYYNTVFDYRMDELTTIYTDVEKMSSPYLSFDGVEVTDSITQECLSRVEFRNVSMDVESEVECIDGDDEVKISTSARLNTSDQSKPRSSLTNLVRVASEAFEDLDQEGQVSSEEDGGTEPECSQFIKDDTDVINNKELKDDKWCGKCERQFTSKKRFSNHMKLVHSGNRHKCKFCSKSFGKSSDRSLHEKRVHTKEKPHQCKTCEKSFCLKRELNHHMKTHEGKDQSCPICNKIFQSEDGLKHHIAAHGEKKYDCRNSSCQRAFATIMLRNRHEKSHSSIRPFTCDKCDAAFKLKHELTRHQLKHTGTKQFKCGKCFRSFVRSEHLKCHMLSHSDARNFKCDICNKTFKQKSGLNVHKHKHVAPFNYVCDVCGYKCHSKSYLQLHAVTHVNDRPFQCSICLAFFKAKKYLSRHLKIHEKKGETTAEKYLEMQKVKSLTSADIAKIQKNTQVIYPKSHHLEKTEKKILPKVSNVLSNERPLQLSSYYANPSTFHKSTTILPSLQEAFRTSSMADVVLQHEQNTMAHLVRTPQNVQVNEDLLEFSNTVVIGQVLPSGNMTEKSIISANSSGQGVVNWECQNQAIVDCSSVDLSHENYVPGLNADDFL